MNLSLRVGDEIAATLRSNGPLWSLKEEWCSQAFQQAHAVRAMLASHRIHPRRIYLEQAAAWAGMTLRLQGTQGHPDAYNMGYGLRLRAGVPENWFVADCGTIATALLDTASLLAPAHPLRARIVESVQRFAEHVREAWTLPDGSVTLGFLDFARQDREAYHCANAQTNTFLWPLYAMTGQERYREQALGTTRWLAGWEDYDCSFWGGPVANRAYNGESLLVSLAHLPADETRLRSRVRDNLSRHIVHWAVKSFGKEWFKAGRPSHAKDPLLLMALRLCQGAGITTRGLSQVLKQASADLDRLVTESLAAVRRHGASGWAIATKTQPRDLFESLTLAKFYASDGLTGMCLAVRHDPASLFPLGSEEPAAEPLALTAR